MLKEETLETEKSKVLSSEEVLSCWPL